MTLLGKKIKNLRNEKRYTQSELAERLGVTKSTIAAYENDTRMPSYDVLIKISRLFHVSIDSLLTGESKGVFIKIECLTDKQKDILLQLVTLFLEDNLNREIISADEIVKAQGIESLTRNLIEKR